LIGAEEISRHVRDIENRALADLNLLDRIAPVANSEKGIRDKRDSRGTLRRKGLRSREHSGQGGDNRDNGELWPHFELLERDGAMREAGVYWVDIARDGGGEITGYAPPRWICSPLRVAADTRDMQGGEWGRLLVFPDRDGREHRWCMPMRMLAGGGEELRGELLAEGLTITSNTKDRGKLAD